MPDDKMSQNDGLVASERARFLVGKITFERLADDNLKLCLDSDSQRSSALSKVRAKNG